MTTKPTTTPTMIGRLLIASTFVACVAATMPTTKGPAPPAAVGQVETTAAAQTAPQATTSTTTSTLLPAPSCELVCEGAQVVPRPTDSPDYHAAAVANADKVLASMHDDLLACYKHRLAVSPQAHGFITIGIIVNTDGSVRDVETSGGALLGNTAMQCIVSRVRNATFDPVQGGGTRRISVPFTLRRVTADQSI